MSERRNPYHVLGLKKGATEAQIKEAYKVLARKHHPDRNQGDPGARDRFIEIKEAYEALIERKTRSPVLAQVEETNAELRRAGVYGRWARRIATGAGVAAAAVAAFLLRGQIDYRARVLLARGRDAKTAERWLAPIADGGGPHAVEARIDLVRRHLAAKDRGSAERLLAGADDPLGLAILGDLHASAGKRGETRRAYERAIARGTAAETWARAWAGLISAGEEEVAKRVLLDAASRFPGDPWVKWMAGVRDLRAGRPERTLALLAGDDRPAARSARAAALVASARLLGDDPRRLDERSYLLGEAERLLRQGEVADTPGDFGWLRPPAELLRSRPFEWRPTTSLADPEVSRSLARSAAAAALGTAEGDASAIKHARLARDRDPGSLEALLALGAAHLARDSREADDPGQAKVAFGYARAVAPNSAAAAAGFALAIAAARPDPARVPDDWRAELAAWKQALELEPENGEWHHGLARSWSRAGREQIQERIAADRRAIRLTPDYGDPWIDLAGAYIDLDRMGEAEKVLQSATAVPEAATRAWKELGDYHYFMRRYPAALAAYRNAASDPDPRAQSAAWLGIAKVHGQMKRAREAYDAMDRATSLNLDIKPDHNDPALQWVFRGYRPKTESRGQDAGARAERLADGYYRQKQYPEAIAAYSEASIYGDAEVRARATHGLARALALAGNVGEAIRAMNRALRLAPDLPLDPADPGVAKLLAAGYDPPREDGGS